MEYGTRFILNKVNGSVVGGSGRHPDEVEKEDCSSITYLALPQKGLRGDLALQLSLRRRKALFQRFIFALNQVCKGADKSLHSIFCFTIRHFTVTIYLASNTMDEQCCLIREFSHNRFHDEL